MPLASSRPSYWLPLTLAVLLATPMVGAAQQPLAAPCGDTVTLGNAASCCEDRLFSTRYTSYFWLTQMHGDLTLRGRTADVDVSFSKTLDLIFGDLNFAFLGQVEASYGGIGVLVNGVYMDIALGGQVNNVNFSSDFTQTILDAAFTYELGGVSETLGLCAGTRMELLAGLRYNALTGGLTLTDSSGATASANGSQEWVDPIIGGRVRLPWNECWTFTGRGDIGGFGIGKASDFTWNVELMAEYKWSESCTLIAGWRWLDIDYTNGQGSMQFGYDMMISGPVMGLAINF
jgi:hypothetical protein